MVELSILIRHQAGPTGDVLLGKNENGVWEFPCGCVKAGETEEDAAKRIAWEVLGLEINVGKRVLIGHKAPKDGTVEHLYSGNITHDTHTKANFHCYYDAVKKWPCKMPAEGKYTEYKWVHPSELGAVEYEGDDKNFMAKYDKWVNAQFIPDVRML